MRLVYFQSAGGARNWGDIISNDVTCGIKSIRIDSILKSFRFRRMRTANTM